MKIRSGFVSNSSSSSFVIGMSRGKTLKSIITDEKIEEKISSDRYDDVSIESVNKLIKKFEKHLEIWEANEDESYNIIEEIIRESDCVLASLDSSSDSGQLIIADPKVLNKLIEDSK